MALANYAAVRSVLRKLALEESLTHVWQFSRHVSMGRPLHYAYARNDPKGAWHKLRDYVFPHELELLARELLLHADRSGRPGTLTLAKWDDLAEVMNAMKKFGNDVIDPDAEGGVLLSLHRIAHQQFPRFSRLTKLKVGRYLALYSSLGLREVFERQLGIEVETYFTLAFALYSVAVQGAWISTNTDFSLVDIDHSQSRPFFERLIGQLPEVRRKLIDEQKLNFCWEFTFNTFHFKPLLAMHPKRPDMTCCPLPGALEKRLFEGLYYDLFRDKKFAKPYGDGVELIVGRLLAELRPAFEVSKPEPEQVGKKRYDGTDFIVSSDDEVAYVECKAKRISLDGRIAENFAALDEDLSVLADAVVQNYANLHRDLQKQDSKQQFFCVVITLEDWFLFSLITAERLHTIVVEKLANAGLPADMIERVPYRIFSFEAAQYVCSVLRGRTMVDVFGLGQKPQDVGMGYINALKDRYPNADPDSMGGFEKDFSDLIDGVLEGAKFKAALGQRAGTV